MLGQQPGPVLGFDIGGTKLATGVVTPDGKVHGFVVEPTYADAGPDVVISRLFDLGRRSVEIAGLGSPELIGIACGGPLDSGKGIVQCPPHLPGWIDIPLVAKAEEAFGVPAFLENDATAAALGEACFGAGAGAQSLVYLTISTGIGGGVVINGRLHRGATGNGGELGHVTVRPGGRRCDADGRQGCLEAYCSGTNIAARARDAVSSALAAGRSTTLAGIDPLTAADVTCAAAAGDAVASEVWRETTDLLGQGLTDIVNVLEPEVVVLGGGVTRSGNMLLDPVTKVIRAGVLGPEAQAVRIHLAGLGDEVGVVGAAAVAWDRTSNQAN